MTWCRRFLVEPDCTYCPLQRSIIVPPEGDDQAKIAIVGEGPGHNEEREKRPFIGDSGQMLNWLLKRSSIDRKKLWISNAALCKPRSRIIDPSRDYRITKKQAMEESTLEWCRPRALAELAQVKPKVIIAAGAMAMRALTGAEGILKYHGATIPIDLKGLAAGRDAFDLSESNTTYVLPTFHPAHLLRGETRKIQAVVDVYNKAKRISVEGPRPQGEFLLVSPHNPRGVDVVISELEFIVDELIRIGADIAVDVEATNEKAVDTTLTVVGFGSALLNLGVAVNVIAWDRIDQRYVACWTPSQWNRIYAALNKILSSTLTKWYWNLNFDVTVLQRHFDLSGPHADGIHWHWLIQPDLPHSLGFACQQYLDIPAWKAGFWKRQESGEGTNRDLLIYNAQDSLYTMQVVEELKPRVYERRNGHLVEHQLRVAALARKAYITGIPCDLQVLEAKREECTRERDARLNIIRAEVHGNEQALNEFVHHRRCRDAKISAEKRGVGYKEPKRWVIEADEFNVNSPHQMVWLLYHHYKLPIEQRTPGGKPRHSYKAVLNYIKGHPGSELFKAYTEYSEYEAPLRKFNEFEAARDVSTGRIHPPWNVTGQAGTRWRSSDPNMQNLITMMKVCLAAEPGWCWVGADAAQLEKRILAAFAGIKSLLKVFNRPQFDERKEEWKKYDPEWDSHSLVAYMVYGDGYINADLPLRKKLRTLVKRVVYGMDYGAFPPTIQRALLEDRRLTSKLRAELVGEAGLIRVQTIFDGFHSYFPEVGQWAVAEVAKAKLKGYQEFLPLNRRRYWPVRDIEEPKIRNTPVQLAAGDVVNLAFLKMDDEIVAKELKSTMVIHGHDACYWYTWKPHANQVREIVNRNFESWFPGVAGPVHITGYASIGQTPAEVA